MNQFLFNQFCLFLLILSVMGGASSDSFLMLWFFMELNLFSFLGLLMNSYNFFLSNSLITYFLVQSLSSMIILILVVSGASGLVYGGFNYLLLFMVLMKLGGAPFHHWYVMIMNKLSWFHIFILSSVQKILPLFLFFLFLYSDYLVFFFLGVVISMIGLYSQIRVKLIVGYSSVMLIPWMMVSGSLNLGVMTLFYYSVSLGMLVYSFSLNSVVFLGDLGDSGSFSCVLIYFFSVLNMAGFPPTNFFFLKLMIISSGLVGGAYFMVFMLLASAGVILFIYLKLFVVGLSKDHSVGLLLSDLSVWTVSNSWLVVLGGVFLIFY